MKKKTFIVQLLNSKKPSRTSFTQVEDALFYSNDTDAYLVFLPHEQEGFEFNEATVALYNTNDESLVERPAVIETFEGRKSVVLKMTEDILAHWGRWQAQVVFKQGDKINTSVVVRFDTLRYMLDQRPPTLRDVIKLDELYSQLVTVMDEISGKDVISAPEIILARGGEDTLGARLDKEHNEVTAQLAQTEIQKADKKTVEESLSKKRNSLDLISSSDITPELQSSIAGTAPIANSIPSNESVTLNTLGGEVKKQFHDLNDVFEKGSLTVNIYDKELATDNKYYREIDGLLRDSTTFMASGMIPVKSSETYTVSIKNGKTLTPIFFWNDSEKIEHDIKSVSNSTYTILTPVGCTRISFGVALTEDHDTSEFLSTINTIQVEIGDSESEYEPYEYGLVLGGSHYQKNDVIDKLNRTLSSHDEFLFNYSTALTPGINKYDSSLAVDGSYYYSSNGEVRAKSDSSITGLIPVNEETQYTISIDQSGSAKMLGELHFFKSDGTHLKAENIENTPTNKLSFVTPKHCSFVGATFLFGVAHDTLEFERVKSTIQLELGLNVSPLEPYSQRLLFKKEVTEGYDEIKNMLDVMNRKKDRFEGEEILAFGDSITRGTEGGYIKHIEKILNTRIINHGSGGAETGRLVGIMTPIKDRDSYSPPDTPDYSNTSAITIQIGTNKGVDGSLSDIPFDSSKTIDDLPFDNDGSLISTDLEYFNLFPDTFYGNVALCIEYVRFKNPKTKIYLITPPRLLNPSNNVTRDMELVRSALLEIGELYAVPVIDAQINAGINLKNVYKTTYDGAHFNVLGNELWGKYIGYQMLSN